MRRWIVLAGLMLTLATASLVSASHAAGLLEKNFWLSGPRYDGALPACEAGLDNVASAFADKESTYWNSNLAIVGWEGVHELGYRPWAPNAIPRRFCRAVASVSDGRKRSVFYSIGEDTGFMSASWGVEWCVDGLDRNMAYSPNCKMARP